MTARPSGRTSDTLPGIAPGAGIATAPAVQPSVARAAVPARVSPPCLLSLMREKCPTRDLSGPASFAAHTLGREPRPVGSARRFAELTLQNWGLEAIRDNVAVITSELVTNALRYGLPARGRPAPRGVVRMGLVRQGATLLCAVFDPGTKTPVMREPDHFTESGRGLHVIEALSDTWGWTVPDQAGKAVWAMLSGPSR